MCRFVFCFFSNLQRKYGKIGSSYLFQFFLKLALLFRQWRPVNPLAPQRAAPWAISQSTVCRPGLDGWKAKKTVVSGCQVTLKKKKDFENLQLKISHYSVITGRFPETAAVCVTHSMDFTRPIPSIWKHSRRSKTPHKLSYFSYFPIMSHPHTESKLKTQCAPSEMKSKSLLLDKRHLIQFIKFDQAA